MASQRSKDRLYIAPDFTHLVYQVRDTRDQLNALKIGHPVLECTIGCMSGETIMIEDALSYIREYCMENKDISRRDPQLVEEINSACFATSVTLSDILNEAKEKSADSINSRSSRYSRFLTSSDAKARKYDGMDSVLHRLFVCSSVLRVLYRLIDPFERRGLDPQGLSRYRHSIASKLEAEMGRRFATKPASPHYVRSLWQEHRIVYPLTSELMSHGLSEQQVLDVYEKSNQKPFVVKHILMTWKSYGYEEDYRLALTTLARNGCNVQATDEILTVFLSHGQQLYADLLKALHKAECKYSSILRSLSELSYLTRVIQWEESSEGSAIKNGIRDHIHNAINVYNYDLGLMCNDLASLRGISLKDEMRTIQSPLATPIITRTRFSPVLYLQLWEHNKYRSPHAIQSVHLVQANARAMSVIWSFEEALLALSDNLFEVSLFYKELTMIRDVFVYQGAPLIFTHHVHSYSLAEISSAMRGMAKKMHNSWRIEGFFRMANRCAYDLDVMLDMQTQLESAFPVSVVQKGICWDWLAFNGFDLDMTRDDASRFPMVILSRIPRYQRAYLCDLRGISHNYGLEISDEFLARLFER